MPGVNDGLIDGFGLEGGNIGECCADIGRFSSAAEVGLVRPSPRVVLRPVNPATELSPFSSSPNPVIPASSRIRNILNLSRRLFRTGRLFPTGTSPPCPSSSLLNIISGLLWRVFIELAVFLRSLLLGEGSGGDTTGSFAVFRESHENGLVSFLVGGAGIDRGAAEGGGGGGGAHGTAGKAPDNPVKGFADRGGGMGLGSGAVGC